MELPPDFSEFFDCLDARRAEYLVVGAYALALHGAPRFTGDIDVLIRPTPENATRVLDAIAAFGFPTGQLSPERLCQPEALVEMGVPPVQIHLMSSISGVSWDEAWLGRVESEVGPRQLQFIGRTELVTNKRAAGRSKDPRGPRGPRRIAGLPAGATGVLRSTAAPVPQAEVHAPGSDPWDDGVRHDGVRPLGRQGQTLVN